MVSGKLSVAAAACGALIAALALSSFLSESEEPEGVALGGPVELFTKLHSAAALQAYCAHIGRVRKQPVSPCPPGGAHPCCTKKELQMMKMQGSTPTNFDWADPSSWSGSKGAAAQHLAHKHAQYASIPGMSQPSAQEGWQTASSQPGYQPTPQYAQTPQYVQAPQYQQPAQQGYWPHLLPGQNGVPEQGAPVASQYAQQPGYQQQPYGAAYFSPHMGPTMAQGQYPQQRMYAQPQYQPPQEGGYAPQYPEEAQYAQPQQAQQQAYRPPQVYAAPAAAPQFQYPKI